MRGNPITLQDFRGGLDLRHNLDDTVTQTSFKDNAVSAQLVKNVVSAPDGSLRKRYGHTNLVTSFTNTPPIIGLGGISHGPSFSGCLVVMTGTNGLQAKKVTYDGTVTDITGSATVQDCFYVMTVGPIAGGEFCLYMVNGIGDAFYWTGTGNLVNWNTAVGGIGVPGGTCIACWRDRIYISGYDDYDAKVNRVYWSAQGDPASAIATSEWYSNWVDLDPWDGDHIRAMVPFGPYLVVFKTRKTFVIYDDASGANRMVSGNVGCSSHDSVAVSPEGVYFHTCDNRIMLFDGKKFKDISKPIEAMIPDPYIFSISIYEQYTGAYFDGSYYFGPFTYGGDLLTIQYDTVSGSWWVHENASLYHTSRLHVQDGVFYGGYIYDLTGSKTSLVKMFQPGTYQDKSTNYDSEWISNWISLGAPFLKKRVRQIRTYGQGTVSSSLYRNYSLSSPVSLGSNIFTAATSPTMAKFYTPEHSSTVLSRAFAVGFSQTVTNDDFTIDSVTASVTSRTD